MTLATLMLAAVNLSLSNVLWWLFVGLIAGFLASRVMRGGGYGLIGDIVVGIIGAFLGGWLAGLLGFGSFGLIGTIVVAFIGACILLAILHAVSRGGASRSKRMGTVVNEKVMFRQIGAIILVASPGVRPVAWPQP